MNIYESLTADSIMASLNYIRPNQTIGYQDSRNLLTVETQIMNARYHYGDKTLDSCGFQLGFDNELQEKLNNLKGAQLYELGEQLVSKLSFKHHLLISSVKRSSNCQVTPKTNSPLELRPAANIVHADWGPSRIKRLGRVQDSVINMSQTTPDKIGQFIKGHSQWYIFNFWLPIDLVINNALALCDKSSIDIKDCFEVDFEGMAQEKKEVKESINAPILAMQANMNHDWYYFPLMQPGEYLIFFQASAIKSLGASVMHTNIELPFRAPIRRSIELRYLMA